MTRRNQRDEEEIWCRTLAAVRSELAALPLAERSWLERQLARIATLQERLHAFFLAADGPELCRACDGACCGCGRNHLTLGNLLAILLAGREPPVPDWSAPCPWLAADGCRLPVAWRPFNCVSFVCEAVEERLADVDRESFYRLERELRAGYDALARRYPGGGRQGLLLRAERLGLRGFLSDPGAPVV
ncbi:hypothetical protein JCM30471_19750 [Desulfuromonas carbonis]|uniref:hypothetical protein n=1 Tax=Desulfuromonas sp. DDH964 TaxID=1823759 RepID=UPI00078DD19D|nr:hypothetical protein [Desulfuromonas sp. DDH964]AMV73558.1 hypothetical protein DBW_3253 [Desulfuromonas sp. DDH964]